MSRAAFTARDFEAGARALVDRWSIDPAAVNASMTVRWVEETDPVRRNAAAGGYVAAEGHLVVPERSGTLQNDETNERPGSTDHEDDENLEDDAIEEEEEEDDDAAAPRAIPPRGSHIRSYHVVYSKSYGCPVLLVRGVSCEPPGGRVMGHAETEASLVAAATRGAEGGAEEEQRRRAVSLPNVDGEPYGQYGRYGRCGLTLFAPWEHPHGRGGGWVGVHPCETRSAMATLLAGEGDGVGSGSAMYMSAWISFVATAVADLPVPEHRINSRR